MNREGRNCIWCGTVNPRTSHWRVGNKRFCCKAHRQNYIDQQEDDPVFERGHEPPKGENGHALPYFPADSRSHVVTTLVHGSSPKSRR